MGLTGGIASGKSTVDATLERLGAALIDADALVHEALEPGRPEHEAVVAAFGREVVKDDGHIDRRRRAVAFLPTPACAPG